MMLTIHCDLLEVAGPERFPRPGLFLYHQFKRNLHPVEFIRRDFSQ